MAGLFKNYRENDLLDLELKYKNDNEILDLIITIKELQKENETLNHEREACYACNN